MIKRILFLFSFFIVFHTSILKAQNYTFKTHLIVGDEEKELLDDSEWYLSYENYTRALPYFVKLYKRYPGAIEYKYFAAICYLHKPDEQDKAINLLEEVYETDPKLKDLLFHLGKAYLFEYRFDEAKGYFKLALESKYTSGDYKKLIPRLLENCENGKILISSYVEGRLQIENIGEPINTEYDEYVPLVSADESVMIFTYKGKRSKGGLQNEWLEADPDGDYFEDIFVSYRMGNKWLEGEQIGYKINTKENEASIALSPDGHQLFIYMGIKGGDIYISYLVRNTWIAPVRLEGDVNTKHWEGSASLSADGKTLYFSSDRPGGLGGKDIYKASLMENGSWENVENLGPNINTTYNDDAPFIHAKGDLLYYGSEGLNSMGGYDIFFSTLKDGKWGKPENLGYPINTPNDDIFYIASASGERGYFSSARSGGFGGQDIYVVKPGIFGEKPVLALIKGIIQNKGRNAEVTIKVVNLTKNESYGIYKSNSSTGNYLLALPPGYDYKIDFELKGKVVHTDILNTKSLNTYMEIEQDFELSAQRNPEIKSTDIFQKNLNQKIEEIKKAEEIAIAKEAAISEVEENDTATSEESVIARIAEETPAVDEEQPPEETAQTEKTAPDAKEEELSAVEEKETEIAKEEEAPAPEEQSPEQTAQAEKTAPDATEEETSAVEEQETEKVKEEEAPAPEEQSPEQTAQAEKATPDATEEEPSEEEEQETEKVKEKEAPAQEEPSPEQTARLE